jgi:hypothetical protein
LRRAFVTRRIRTIVITTAGAAALAVAGLSIPASAAQSPSPAPGVATPNIVGGHEATIPHDAIGALTIDRAGDPGHFTCEAVLAPVRGWATTSAHCVTAVGSSDPLPANLFHVRFGSTSRTTGGVAVDVAQILINAAWAWQDGPGIVGDLAVLKLSSTVPVQQLQIPTRVQVNAKTWLLGWGGTEPDGGGDRPDDLQQIESTVVRHDLPGCTELPIGADQICVNNPNGTDGPCRGDSGGPALQRVPGTGTRTEPARYWVVGGLVGSISPCGSHPYAYTDWTYWRSWIYQAITTGQVPPRTDGGSARHGIVKPGRIWA